MTEWQPIETAPNDGTEILLFFPNKNDYRIPCGVIEGWWFFSPKEIDNGWETIVGGIGEPSHWMPLPTPPRVDTR